MNKLPNHRLELKDFQKEIELLKSVGFNPIGVTQIHFEKTFVFETEEEARKAYRQFERNEKEEWIGEVVGWYYGKEEFLKAIVEYESKLPDYFVKVFWLTEIDKIK
jgi:ribosomal protein L10